MIGYFDATFNPDVKIDRYEVLGKFTLLIKFTEKIKEFELIDIDPVEKIPLDSYTWFIVLDVEGEHIIEFNNFILENDYVYNSPISIKVKFPYKIHKIHSYGELTIEEEEYPQDTFDRTVARELMNWINERI